MPYLKHSRRPPALALPVLLTAVALALVCGYVFAHAAEADWHLYVGDAVVDTVNAPLDQVHLAGQWVLLTDKWTIERNNDKVGELVTSWRPVKHPLVHLVAGNARVRVAVSLKAAGPGRTEVRVLGGIATQADLAGGPVLPLAQAAGQKECRGYVTELKARLADLLTADGAPSGSPRSAVADKR
jgi:hypothetical protein